jgi:hypothetical protein
LCSSSLPAHISTEGQQEIPQCCPVVTQPVVTQALTQGTNGGSTNGGGDVVVGRGDVSGEGTQGVEGSLHAPAGGPQVYGQYEGTPQLDAVLVTSVLGDPLHKISKEKKLRKRQRCCATIWNIWMPEATGTASDVTKAAALVPSAQHHPPIGRPTPPNTTNPRLTSPAASPCSQGSCAGARGQGPRSSPDWGGVAGKVRSKSRVLHPACNTCFEAVAVGQ